MQLSVDMDRRGSLKPLENPRNELFASSRYGLKKSHRKILSFRKVMVIQKKCFFTQLSDREFIVSRMDSNINKQCVVYISRNLERKKSPTVENWFAFHEKSRFFQSVKKSD